MDVKSRGQVRVLVQFLSCLLIALATSGQHCEDEDAHAVALLQTGTFVQRSSVPSTFFDEPVAPTEKDKSTWHTNEVPKDHSHPAPNVWARFDVGNNAVPIPPQFRVDEVERTQSEQGMAPISLTEASAQTPAAEQQEDRSPQAKHGRPNTPSAIEDIAKVADGIGETFGAISNDAAKVADKLNLSAKALEILAIEPPVAAGGARESEDISSSRSLAKAMSAVGLSSSGVSPDADASRPNELPDVNESPLAAGGAGDLEDIASSQSLLKATPTVGLSSSGVSIDADAFRPTELADASESPLAAGGARDAEDIASLPSLSKPMPTVGLSNSGVSTDADASRDYDEIEPPDAAAKFVECEEEFGDCSGSKDRLKRPVALDLAAADSVEQFSLINTKPGSQTDAGNQALVRTGGEIAGSDEGQADIEKTVADGGAHGSEDSGGSKDNGRTLTSPKSVFFSTGKKTGSDIREKSKITLALITAFQLGACGVDRCYMGDTALGIVKGVTLGGCLIWHVMDYFIITINSLSKSDSIEVLGFRAKFPKDDVDTAFYTALVSLVLMCFGPLQRVCARMLSRGEDKFDFSYGGDDYTDEPFKGEAEQSHGANSHEFFHKDPTEPSSAKGDVM